MGAPESKSVLVALWMNGVFGNEIYEGASEWLRERSLDWRIRFVTVSDTYDSTARWMLRRNLLDGVITHFDYGPTTEFVARAGIPAVCLGPDHEPPEWRLRRNVASVKPDLAAVSAAAAGHFMERAGFRSFGYVEHFGGYEWSRLRGDAWAAELSRRGIALRRFRHSGAARMHRHGPDFDGLAAWLRALERPAAVLCANDDTAVDTIRIVELAGLSVPRDVAILGIDDNPLHCQNARPNLSSVHLDGRLAGRLAASALADMMAGKAAPPPEKLLYGALRVSRRASTGAVSTAGALVQKALDFIDANACRGASTADVVRHLGVSRSLATLRFRELCGSSILEAVSRRRLAEAKSLLASTDRTMADVARAAGFADSAALGHAFRAAFGLSPRQWRERHRKLSD